MLIYVRDARPGDLLTTASDIDDLNCVPIWFGNSVCTVLRIVIQEKDVALSVVNEAGTLMTLTGWFYAVEKIT